MILAKIGSLFGLLLCLSFLPSEVRPQVVTKTGMSACSLQGQCCNMASSNCCTGGGGGRCYTTWERVCDGGEPVNPQCNTVGKRFCIPITSTSCRTVTERIYRNYQISHCAQRPLRKCFKYKRSVCVAKEELTKQEISWTNEKLVLNNATNVQKCFDIQSMTCHPRQGTKTVRVPVQRTKNVPRVDKKCSLQTVRGEDKVIQVPVTEIINRRLCWAIPETKCLNKRVSCGVSCPVGVPCGSPEIQQQPQQVCPLSGSQGSGAFGGGGGAAAGSNCISVNPPTCGASGCPGPGVGGQSGVIGGSVGGMTGGVGMVGTSMSGMIGTSMGGSGMIGTNMGGSGMIGGNMGGSGMIGGNMGGSGMIGSNMGGSGMIGGNMGGSGMIGSNMGQSGMVQSAVMSSAAVGQLCCRQVTKNICRQVPTRVTKLVSKVVPGKVGYKRVCKDVVSQIPQTYWDEDVKYVNYTRNDCRPTVKNECINLTVRTFDVNTEEVSDSVDVHLPKCESKDVDAEYCHTFPTGNIVCRNSTVPKSFNLHKIKCDVKKQSTQCAVIPILQCSNNGGSTPQTCRMVPKTVCPPANSCKKGGNCGQCDAFRRNSGFGTCPGSNCPNFASADNWSSENNANEFYNSLNRIPTTSLAANVNNDILEFPQSNAGSGSQGLIPPMETSNVFGRPLGGMEGGSGTPYNIGPNNRGDYSP